MKIQKVLLLALCATAAWGQSVQKGTLVDRGTAAYTTGAVGNLAFGDNRYCAKGDIPAFGAAYDGPAQLPIACFYTGTDGTPSGLHTNGATATTWQVRSDTDTARCLPGPPDNGQCAVNDWNAAMAGLACGDIVQIEHGAVLLAPASTGFVLPHLACDVNHWITVESDSVVGDANFPAVGTRATPCHIGLASVANYPDYPCGAAHGSVGAGPAAAQRMAKFVTTGTTAPAMTLDNQVAPTCAAFPCTDHWRFIGLEFTNQPPNAGGSPSTRTSHKLLEFLGGDHMILDRSIVHAQDDPGFNKTSEVQGGVNFNGSYLAVIDSWIYDIVCTNANIGPSCVDSQGIAGGTGSYPQVAQKIVNNLVAASGESWFWGGGQQAYLPTASNADGNTADIEVRRNHSFKPLSWMLPIGLSAGTTNHWDPKNLGETKTSNRSLWEGNVAENSWTGWQSDQFGNAFLTTPKNQNAKLATTGTTVTGGTDGFGNNILTCSATTGLCQFSCEEDPNAVPDPTGVGTTVASCGAVVTFPGGAGSYNKVCPPFGNGTGCRIVIGSNKYHITAYVSPTVVQVSESTAGVSAASYTAYRRGLNPSAVVRNFTVRDSIIRHVTDVMEVLSGADDGGEEALGVHNASIHDIVAYDVDATFWDNNNSCCTMGWFVKLESSTLVPTTVPSDITADHNSVALIGWQGRQQGLVSWFDLKVLTTDTAPYVNAHYFSNIKVRNNITAAAVQITKAGGPYFATPSTVSAGASVYGCSDNNGGLSGGACTYDLTKNLLLTGLWGSQNDNPSDLHLLGSNTVEACSCTITANGGACTPGSPNTWSSPVTAGSIDACDRATSAGLYTDIFTTWDVNGTNAMDLHLKAGSPYIGQATDGGNLGANVDLVNTMTAGVANAVSYAALSITTTSLPNGTNGTAYSQQVIATAGASPYKLWAVSAGALPTGLSLAKADGTVSGTSTATGNFNFTVQVEDAGHQFATRTLSIQVN